MPIRKFSHLHTHSQYSILDGLGKPDDIFKKAKELNFKAIAITDHSNMDGYVKCIKASEETGVKYIPGCELYIVDSIENYKKVKAKGIKRTHITVYAMNNLGVTNLFNILNRANSDNNFYKRPLIEWNDLVELKTSDLYFGTACSSGINIRKDRVNIIKMFLNKISEKLFIEVMPHLMDEQKEANFNGIKLSEQFNLPLIATNDNHYINSSDSYYQEVLLAMQTKAKWNDPKRWKFSITGLYMRTEKEMEEVFKEQGILDKKQIINSLENTSIISDNSNCVFKQKKVELPVVYEDKKQSDKDTLESLVIDGFENLIVNRKNLSDKEYNIYCDRIEEELGLIHKLNFDGYFILVYDFVKWAKENDILVGPGRGCFTPDSKVYILDFSESELCQCKIKNIIDGDKVITHNGSIGTVLKKFEYYIDEEIIEIHMSDGKIIQCTKDHKVFTKDGLKMACELTDKSSLIESKIIFEGNIIGESSLYYNQVNYITNKHYKGKVYDLEIDKGTYNIEGLGVHNSSGGSLVAYCLGITGVDPIQYNLLFARFISPARIDLPDIDLDFEDRKRHKIKEYLESKYGKDCVASISTFAEMNGRGALRDIARVFSVPLIEVDKAAKAIVVRGGGDIRSTFSIKDAFDTFEEGKLFLKKYPKVSQTAMAMEGTMKNTGIHAAGIVVSLNSLQSGLQGYVAKRRDIHAINWDKEDLEYMGLMKLDILGLNILSILSQCSDFVVANGGKKIDFYGMTEFTDKKILNEFNIGNTIGVFQFECIFEDTIIGIKNKIEIKKIIAGSKTESITEDGKIIFNKVKRIVKTGVKKVFLLTLEKTDILATEEHRFKTRNGWKKLSEITINDEILTFTNSYSKILSIQQWKEVETYDMEMENRKFPNYIANGIVVHNSYGIRKLTFQCGVKEFKDIYDINALFRPGALRSGLSTDYVARKHGQKKYGKVHEEISKITKDTYGIILYQEQIMNLLYNLGGLPWKTTDMVRKVVSKSKGIEQFQKFKGMFVKGCLKRTSMSKEEAGAIFDEMKHFGNYGFNLCVSENTRVTTFYKDSKTEMTIKEMYLKKPKYVYSYDIKAKKQIKTLIKDIVKCGRKKVFQLRCLSPLSIKHITTTNEHKFLTENGWQQLKNLKVGDKILTKRSIYDRQYYDKYGGEFEFSIIRDINYAGYEETYDIHVDHLCHNYLANEFVVHNSHSVEYSVIAWQCMYCKVYHPLEYMQALLSYTTKNKDRFQVYIDEALRLEIKIEFVDINISDSIEWRFNNGKLYVPFIAVKNIGDKAAKEIVKARESGYKNKEDFMNKINKRIINIRIRKALETSGAFRVWDSNSHDIQKAVTMYDFTWIKDKQYNTWNDFVSKTYELGPLGQKCDVNKWYFGLMTELKFGYHAKGKSGKITESLRNILGTSESLGGAYGFLRNTDSEYGMVTFNVEMFYHLKERIERCARKFILVRGMPDTFSNNIIADRFYDEDDFLKCKVPLNIYESKKPDYDFNNTKDCNKCKLSEECSIKVNTEYNSNIVILGEAPGREEHKIGKPFLGAAGSELFSTLGKMGINREDVTVSNCCKCFPSKTKTPTDKHIKTCTEHYLKKELEAIKPILILALGNTALKFVKDESSGIRDLSGKTEWNIKLNCWVTYCVHPASVIYDKGANGEIFNNSLKAFVDNIKMISGIHQDKWRKYHVF